MLRHKCFSLAAAFLVVASVFLAGCKTVSRPENDVDALALLDDDFILYVGIPVQTNKEFTVEAVSKLAGVSSSDSEKIASRLSNVYIGTNLVGKMQLSAECAFPSAFVKMALSEKNGWKANPFENNFFYTRDKSKLQLSVPSASNCCVSYDVRPMLEKFNAAALSEDSLSPMKLDERTVKLLTQNQKGEIVFYAPIARNFLKKFLGTEIPFAVDSITGTLTQLKNSKSFGMTLVIELNDPRTIKAACAALKIALFPVPAKIVQTGTSQITVSDYTFDWKQLLAYVK